MLLVVTNFVSPSGCCINNTASSNKGLLLKVRGKKTAPLPYGDSQQSVVRLYANRAHLCQSSLIDRYFV
jgi:hypothetical protein